MSALPSHKRIYAKGFYDGLQAASERDMTPEKHRRILSAQTVIAQKIFHVVPMQEAWTASQIATALARTGSTRPEMKILEGCLDTLKDAGIVKEKERGLWQQITPREPITLPPEVKSPTIPLLPATEAAIKFVSTEQAAPESPAESLGDIAERLRMKGQHLIKIADEIDSAALMFEERIETAEAKLTRFNALKALLTEG